MVTAQYNQSLLPRKCYQMWAMKYSDQLQAKQTFSSNVVDDLFRASILQSINYQWSMPDHKILFPFQNRCPTFRKNESYDNFKVSAKRYLTIPLMAGFSTRLTAWAAVLQDILCYSFSTEGIQFPSISWYQFYHKLLLITWHETYGLHVLKKMAISYWKKFYAKGIVRCDCWEF